MRTMMSPSSGCEERGSRDSAITCNPSSSCLRSACRQNDPGAASTFRSTDAPATSRSPSCAVPSANLTNLVRSLETGLFDSTGFLLTTCHRLVTLEKDHSVPFARWWQPIRLTVAQRPTQEHRRWRFAPDDPGLCLALPYCGSPHRLRHRF